MKPKQMLFTAAVALVAVAVAYRFSQTRKLLTGEG
jgi:hypothetical protein